MGCNKGIEFNVEKIKRLMVLKGWTFADMACACGCDRSQISNILRVGRCRPSTLKMIVDALGVEVVDVLANQEGTVDTIHVVLDDGAYMPTRAHDTDAGLDLYSPIDIVINGDSEWYECFTEIDTGVHIQIPVGYVGDVKSKSGLMMKHNITTDGTVDAGYTGSVRVKLFNHGVSPVKIEAGQKIAQLVIKKIITPTPVLVDSLEETERGDNGFGSTGKF